MTSFLFFFSFDTSSGLSSSYLFENDIYVTFVIFVVVIFYFFFWFLRSVTIVILKRNLVKAESFALFFGLVDRLLFNPCLYFS